MSKMRIAISPSSFAESDRTPLTMLEQAGVEVIRNMYKRRLTEDEVIEHIRDADGLLAGVEPLTKRVFSASPRLKALARVGIGMANVDLDAAQESGIKISNTPEGPTQAVAEMTVGAMLALSRGMVRANDAMHAGKWEKRVTKGLEGLKVAFVGYGRIGRRVREMLRPFGILALIVDPNIDSKSLAEDDTRCTLDESLNQADIITLHASGSEAILGRGEFGRVKKGALILNAARGELVDEQALVESLRSGQVGGAWFDVFMQEPYSGPLQGIENVLLTPHISTYTVQCRLSMECAAVKNILHDLGVSR